MKCPKCNAPIPNINLNIATDIAQCEECKLVFKISENVASLKNEQAATSMDPNFNIESPPLGAWIEHHNDCLVLGATTRSAMAFFLVPFMLVWSGGSLGGIYGSQIISGEFDIFMSLFGIPFLLGSVLFWGIALMFIWGKVELTLDHTDGKIFTGIGTLGYTQRFLLDEIDRADEKISRGNKGSINHSIALEGQRRITFGAFLSESRRYYLLKALQKVLHDKAHNRNFMKPNLMKHLIGK